MVDCIFVCAQGVDGHRLTKCYAGPGTHPERQSKNTRHRAISCAFGFVIEFKLVLVIETDTLRSASTVGTLQR